MPQEKERVRQVSGEPCGRVGEPEQDPDRGAEGSQRPLLPQGRVAARKRDSRRETALAVFVFLLALARRIPPTPPPGSSRSYLVVFCMSRLRCPTRLPAGFFLFFSRSRPMRRGGRGSVGASWGRGSRRVRPGFAPGGSLGGQTHKPTRKKVHQHLQPRPPDDAPGGHRASRAAGGDAPAQRSELQTSV